MNAELYEPVRPLVRAAIIDCIEHDAFRGCDSSICVWKWTDSRMLACWCPGYSYGRLFNFYGEAPKECIPGLEQYETIPEPDLIILLEERLNER